ncbi:hypothetical protein GOBAR_AA27613 [Gossypium barbadense]|uniref:Uncharacterized protein n=1 Tax=Gossypium barbadense TaxID=3634 RepID=A0A2P5WPP0_GOSBA|nr:hypothetical protein GOBAR_AA27613 [Gossypium barbadense]
MISIGSPRGITTTGARGVGHAGGATSIVLFVHSCLTGSSWCLGGEVGAAPTFQSFHCPIISNKPFLDSIPSTPLLNTRSRTSRYWIGITLHLLRVKISNV